MFEVSNNNYFEGILQLRDAGELATLFVKERLEASKSFISKIVSRKNGVDLYLSDQHFLQTLGHSIKKRFGGEITVSVKLHTVHKQTSKELYRVTVLYRGPRFKKGDIIKLGKKIIRVSSCMEMVRGTDLVTGKRISVAYKKSDAHILCLKKTKVMKLHPHVEIMHPETYQSVKAINRTGHDLQLEENISAVFDDETIIIS